jgi:hypothetical protein
LFAQPIGDAEVDPAVFLLVADGESEDLLLGQSFETFHQALISHLGRVNAQLRMASGFVHTHVFTTCTQQHETCQKAPRASEPHNDAPGGGAAAPGPEPETDDIEAAAERFETITAGDRRRASQNPKRSYIHYYSPWPTQKRS